MVGGEEGEEGGFAGAVGAEEGPALGAVEGPVEAWFGGGGILGIIEDGLVVPVAEDGFGAVGDADAGHFDEGFAFTMGSSVLSGDGRIAGGLAYQA